MSRAHATPGLGPADGNLMLEVAYEVFADSGRNMGRLCICNNKGGKELALT